MKAIRLIIVEIDHSKEHELHRDWQQVPEGMTLLAVIRRMLAKAGEKFQDPPEPVQHD